MQSILAGIDGAFEGARDPARAVSMRAYMKDQFPFLGLPRPVRDQLERPVLAGLRRQPLDELEVAELARACWERDEREHQYFALSVLRRHAPRLGPRFIETAHHLVTHRSWWDTVDELAAHLVGPLVKQHPGLLAAMDAWIADPHLWLRRTAILHQLRYRQATDQERLFRYCRACAGETDFFIRKAIGWALREHGKLAPLPVRAFVEAEGERLSGLSRREALRSLPGTSS